MSTVRTVTLSPGFDHVVAVDALRPGDVTQVISWQREPAGKGVNAARALRYLGADTVAYTLVGEPERGIFEAALDADGIRHATFGVPQSTRDNLTLSIKGSNSIAAHAAGPRLSNVPESTFEALFEKLLQDISPGDVVTFNGSLPTGADPSIWARWACKLRGSGIKLVVDTSGPALGHMLQVGGFHAAMPNQTEINDIPGLSADGDPLQRAEAALRLLHQSGIPEPMVTLGAMGVLHLVDGKPRRSTCTVAVPRVVVGAGDAFLAGYCAALVRSDWGDCPVLTGLAAAAAHVSGASRNGFAPAARDALLRTASQRI